MMSDRTLCEGVKDSELCKTCGRCWHTYDGREAISYFFSAPPMRGNGECKYYEKLNDKN